MGDDKNLQLDERRFDLDSEALGEWEFASKFPKLALACLENAEMEKALEVDAPQVTHGHLVKTMRGWESKAVAIEDVEKLVELHLIGLVGALTSFAAGYAHEVATGVELRCSLKELFKRSRRSARR